MATKTPYWLKQNRMDQERLAAGLPLLPIKGKGKKKATRTRYSEEKARSTSQYGNAGSRKMR